MNDYKVIRQIGEGAFGKAFLVHEREGGGDSQRVVKEIDLRKVRQQLYFYQHACSFSNISHLASRRFALLLWWVRGRPVT